MAFVYLSAEDLLVHNVQTERSTDKHVIRLDISMHDVDLAHEIETEEHLVSVCSNSSQVDTDVFAEFANDLS